MKIKITSCILVLFTAGSFLITTAQSPTHMKFTENAVKGGMMEIKLGQLAQSNAGMSEVKMHGQHMIDDHGKANEELKSIAAKKNIPLPSSIDNKMQKKYGKLANLKGKEFDKKYSKYMVHDHKKAICLFKKEAKRGKDPELKAWANDKIPTLKNHLEMWKESCKEVRKEK